MLASHLWRIVYSLKTTRAPANGQPGRTLDRGQPLPGVASRPRSHPYLTASL
jgi:hypothetical protein